MSFHLVSPLMSRVIGCLTLILKNPLFLEMLSFMNIYLPFIYITPFIFSFSLYVVSTPVLSLAILKFDSLLIFLLMLLLPRNLILFLFLLALLLLLYLPLCHRNLLSIYRIFIAIWLLIFFTFHLN